MRLRITFDLQSDFHIGAGVGVGRVVDDLTVRDEQGTPVIPASSVKGLARWHARELIQLHPPLSGDEASDDPEDNPLLIELFGRTGAEQGLVAFDDARPQPRTINPAQVHGRSARDRLSGRARDRALFHVEDAPVGRFVARATSTRAISAQGILLLMAAVRRIEQLGGQRRRGKGRVAVKVEVEEHEPSGGVSLQGATLPVAGEDAAAHNVLREQLQSLFGPGDNPQLPGPSSVPRPRLSLPAEPPAAATYGPIQSRVLLGFAAQPLVLIEDLETTNVIETLPYVLGAQVRGALAWMALRAGWKADDKQFDAAFAREQVRFGPLYPCQNRPVRESLPFPAPHSMMTCKYHPGPLSATPSRRPGQAHGLRDALAAGALAECAWPACGAPLEPVGGFLQLCSTSDQGTPPFTLSAVADRRGSAQRTAVDEQTLRGKDSQLYATESISRGVYFAGLVTGPEQLLDQLANLWPGNGRLSVTVGKSRTRGYGRLDLQLASAAGLHPGYPALLGLDAAGEDDRWDAAVKRDGFNLYLYSDTIAVDGLLRPVTRLDGERLWSLLGGSGAAPWEIRRGYVGQRRVGGFNGVPGVPRMPDVAMTAGSTWRVDWTANTGRDKAVDKLRDAERWGVGLRRGEGFGGIIVDLPLLTARLDQTTAHLPHVDVNAGVAGPLPFEARDLPQPPKVRPRETTRAAGLSPQVRTLVQSRLLQRDLTNAGKLALSRLMWTVLQSDDCRAALEQALEHRRQVQQARHLDAKYEDAVIQKVMEIVSAVPGDEGRRIVEEIAQQLARLGCA